MRPLNTVSPRPWRIVSEEDGDWEHGFYSYVVGIQDAQGNWVVRFDDDYDTDQVSNARFITALANNVVDSCTHKQHDHTRSANGKFVLCLACPGVCYEEH